jgi:hypothetical protein
MIPFEAPESLVMHPRYSGDAAVRLGRGEMEATAFVPNETGN